MNLPYESIPWALAPLIRNELDGSVLVLVPGGSFTMGPAQHGEQSPAHRVTLPPYYMSVSLISCAQFRKFLRTLGAAGLRGAAAAAGDPEAPALGVTWALAKAYAEWAGGRLPTEAEWERAARGVQEYTFPWGNDPSPARPASEVSRSRDIHNPLCVSEFGLLQMSGQCLEWCADLYDEAYYLCSPEINPTGPETDTDPGDDGPPRRVLRGGRQPGAATRRFSERPDEASHDIGFRIVIDVPQENPT